MGFSRNSSDMGDKLCLMQQSTHEKVPRSNPPYKSVRLKMNYVNNIFLTVMPSFVVLWLIFTGTYFHERGIAAFWPLFTAGEKCDNDGDIVKK